MLVQYHHRTGRQTDQRAFGNGYAVVLEELATTQGGQVDHVVQAFGGAEALLGERQVGGDAQHHGVVQVAGLDVEGAHRGGAGRGVDAREDVQHFALAGEVGQGVVGQIAADQAEGRSLAANQRQVAVDAHRVALQGHLAHCLNPLLSKG
ncbi:hypothetical protein D3C78_794700 [compost metagenome]